MVLVYWTDSARIAPREQILRYARDFGRGLSPHRAKNRARRGPRLPLGYASFTPA